MSSIATLKAFLQDKTIREEYVITDADIAGASMTSNSQETNMMIVLLKEMVQHHTEKNTPRVIATRLNAVLTSRL